MVLLPLPFEPLLPFIVLYFNGFFL